MRVFWLIVVLILAGCADPARNLYEGIRQNNEAKRTPMERATQPVPNYDSYRKSLETPDSE